VRGEKRIGSCCGIVRGGEIDLNVMIILGSILGMKMVVNRIFILAPNITIIIYDITINAVNNIIIRYWVCLTNKRY